MKKLISFGLAAFYAVVTVQSAVSQDAASIVQASRDRIDAKTVSTRSRMVITAKNGSTSERVIDQYSKDYAQGNSRIVITLTFRLSKR